MYSIGFPDIFNGSSVNLVKDEDALASNLELLLGSNRGGLYGDPHYGVNIKQILWDQEIDPLMKSLVRDEIYEAIISYMPQSTVNRDDIELVTDGTFATVKIKVKNDLGIASNLLEIKLLDGTDELEETIY